MGKVTIASAVCLVAQVLGCAGAMSQGRQVGVAPVAPPGELIDSEVSPVLVCDELVYDFGRVMGGGEICHHFKVKNVSSETIWIRAIPSIGGFTQRMQYCFQPGETKEIPLCVRTGRASGEIRKTMVLRIIPPASGS